MGFRLRNAGAWFSAVLSFLGAALTLGCTNVGLYSTNPAGAGGPDRAVYEGTVCVPPANGDAFPVKVIFAVPGGTGVLPSTVSSIATALSNVSGRFQVPSVTFSLVAYHTVATGLQGGFADATTLQTAITKYVSYQEQGPVSLRAPIELARSILSGDMQSSCKGAVERTRYLVVLVVQDGDTSCANPAFNFGIDGRCTNLLPDTVGCSACELTSVTSSVQALEESLNAGQVLVQPVYIRDTIDPDIATEVAAIAKAGGTQVIQTTPETIDNALESLNYTSLQRQLGLKRLLAWNRNVRVRAGVQMADSDGDGIPDDDEVAIGTDPRNPDTDQDGLMDGIELRMGMDPKTPDTVSSCNPFLDTDGDRLNDCEERVLGTNPCMGDTDSDGLPDLVEALSGSNPLVPEDLKDSDSDGTPDLQEILAHTDPFSDDRAFQVEHGYGYQIADAEPTVDGRPCYQIRISNVGLMGNQGAVHPPYPDIAAGNNDVYVYFEAGRQNDPRGAGVSGLRLDAIQFTPPATRNPAGLIQISPTDFLLGI